MRTTALLATLEIARKTPIFRACCPTIRLNVQPGHTSIASNEYLRDDGPMWGKRALLRALGATVAIVGAPALAQYPWHADDALLADAAEFPTWSDALQRNADQQRGFARAPGDAHG